MILKKVQQVLIKKGNAWEDDTFNRRRTGEMLTSLITSLDQPFVIAVNGGWGSGKTTFLKRMNEHLRCQSPRVHSIYIDAWSNDSHDDPLLALVLATNETLTAAGYVKTGELGRRMVGYALDLAAPAAMIAANAFSPGSGSPAGAAAKVGAEVIRRAADKARARRGLEESLKEARDLLLKRDSDRPIKGQVAIIIDELDRCRPDYAIRMLERVKHLFSLPGYVFIIATDNINLRGAVKTVYGSQTDGEQYLRKFFDFEMHLRQPNSFQFTKALVRQFGSLQDDWFESLKWRKIQNRSFIFDDPRSTEDQWIEAISEYQGCAERFSLSLRDQAQAFSLLNAMMVSLAGRAGFLPPTAAFLSCLRFGHERAFDMIKRDGIIALRSVVANQQEYGSPSGYLTTLCKLLERPEDRWMEALATMQRDSTSANDANRISQRLGVIDQWHELRRTLNDVVFMVEETT